MGPDTEFIRSYVLQSINTTDLPSFFMNRILKKYIPKNKNYGSWESFDIFGVDYKIYLNIRKNIKSYFIAVETIEKKFVPIWLQNAYKINGCMYKRIYKVSSPYGYYLIVTRDA